MGGPPGVSFLCTRPPPLGCRPAATCKGSQSHRRAQNRSELTRKKSRIQTVGIELKLKIL